MVKLPNKKSRYILNESLNDFYNKEVPMYSESLNDFESKHLTRVKRVAIDNNIPCDQSDILAVHTKLFIDRYMNPINSCITEKETSISQIDVLIRGIESTNNNIESLYTMMEAYSKSIDNDPNQILLEFNNILRRKRYVE